VGKTARIDPASCERAVQRAVDVDGLLGVDRVVRVPDKAGPWREERTTGRRRDEDYAEEIPDHAPSSHRHNSCRLRSSKPPLQDGPRCLRCLKAGRESRLSRAFAAMSDGEQRSGGVEALDTKGRDFQVLDRWHFSMTRSAARPIAAPGSQ
jgi:hypothetical protein